ncbi:hypothetical protein D7X33_46580 [Butyricicoccus sp. 1XD8-22]|nr:hypothetical protein D7X33_46580 [Butyricicoccus sp. 1XD8-22]
MEKQKRVKDILTDEELTEIHSLNKEIMNASTKMEIRHLKQEINHIIERATDRYYGSKKAVKNSKGFN